MDDEMTTGANPMSQEVMTAEEVKEVLEWAISMERVQGMSNYYEDAIKLCASHEALRAELEAERGKEIPALVTTFKVGDAEHAMAWPAEKATVALVAELRQRAEAAEAALKIANGPCTEETA